LLVVEIAQNLFTTRRGSLIVGAAAAIVAGVILLVYLHAYRNSLNSSASNVSVLVAKNLIPKGTPGDIVASSDQFQVAELPKGQLQAGALTDPAALSGRIAVADIYPNQQLTANYFAYATPGSLQTKITGDDRAISVSMDAQHGMIGQIGAGDHIDIYIGVNRIGPSGSQPVIKLMMSDVTVLKAPLAGGGGIYTLKANSKQAAALAYAADNGRLWFVLRPASGAKTVNPGFVSLQTLLAGIKPVR
jgi:Flp pilus assembly protein CpaB